jgi:hypothetical protein
MSARPRRAHAGVPRSALALGVLVALALAGCDRKPHLVPASADSTRTPATDSSGAGVEQVRAAWDQGGAEASKLTAQLLLAELKRHPALPLEMRARDYLDSLSLGAEVDGHGDVALVNLFSLSDPAGASWPQLYWRDTLTVHTQPIEGSGMRLAGSAVRTDSTGGVVMQVAGLFTRTAAMGPQPLVFVWRKTPKARSWSLMQTLGPDSLGGNGAARFTGPGRDSAALESRTWQRTAGFEECATCSHRYVVRRFRWGRDGFSTLDSQVEDSPYVAFVRLIQALSIPDFELARALVTDDTVLDSAREYALADRRGAWREAPGGDEVPNEMTFFRGGKEAYKVSFVRLAGLWRVSHLEPTGRSIQ